MASLPRNILLGLHLILILLLAASLRLINLAELPPGLYLDEVSIGYNAYSIVETGLDEHGISHPFWFKAFGEYKLPVYIYLTAFTIKALGFTDLAVRLPSALAGIVTAVLIYFLTKQLLSYSKPKTYTPSFLPPLISGIFFAISPWSIQFSRAGFEANLALLLLVGAAICFLKGFSSKHPILWLVVSALSSVLAMFTYNSARLVVPLLIICSLIIFRSRLRKLKRPTAIAALVGILILFLSLPQQFGTQGTTRALKTTYFNFNKPYQSLTRLATSYFDHFHTTFLFFQGDGIGRHSTSKLGPLYYYDLPLIIMGLFALKNLPRQSKRFLLAWLLIAPIPAALAEPSPHSLRSLNMIPPLIIISSLGLNNLVNFLRKTLKAPLLQFVSYLLLVLIITYHLGLFSQEYFFAYQRVRALDWGDGHKEAVLEIRNRYNDFDHIYVTDELPLIYLATYLPIPPSEYQKFSTTDIHSQPISFDKLSYFSKPWSIDFNPSQTALILSSWWQKPKHSKAYSTIKIKNGDIIYNLWTQDVSN